MEKTKGNLLLLSGSPEEEHDNRNWHMGLATSVVLTYDSEMDKFVQIRSEYQFAGESLRLDVYIQTKPDVVFMDEIGQLFAEHSLISYKGPNDSFLPQDYRMLKSYLAHFQNERNHRGLRSSDIALFAFTTRWPEKIFPFLEEENIPYTIENKWLVRLKMDNVNMYVICIKRLEGFKYTPIRMLRDDLTNADLLQIQEYMDQVEKTGSEDAKRSAQRWIKYISAKNGTLFLEEAREMEFWKKVVYEQYGEEMNQKDQQLADKDQQLADKDQQLADKKRELSSTRRKLTWRNKKIAQQDQTIAQQGQMIAEKDSSLVNCARQMIRKGMKASEIAECTSFSLSRLTRLARSMGVSLVL